MESGVTWQDLEKAHTTLDFCKLMEFFNVSELLCEFWSQPEPIIEKSGRQNLAVTHFVEYFRNVLQPTVHQKKLGVNGIWACNYLHLNLRKVFF